MPHLASPFHLQPVWAIIAKFGDVQVLVEVGVEPFQGTDPGPDDDPGRVPRPRPWFDLGIYAVLLAFAAGWIIAIIYAVTTGQPRPGLARVMANPLSPDAPPPAPYLLDAALRRLVDVSDFEGTSGEVQVMVVEPLHVQPVPE